MSFLKFLVADLNGILKYTLLLTFLMLPATSLGAEALDKHSPHTDGRTCSIELV